MFCQPRQEDITPAQCLEYRLAGDGYCADCRLGLLVARYNEINRRGVLHTPKENPMSELTCKKHPDQPAVGRKRMCAACHKAAADKAAASRAANKVKGGKTSNEQRATSDDLYRGLVLDFSGRNQLYEQLAAKAGREFRTVEQQALCLIAKALAYKNNHPEVVEA